MAITVRSGQLLHSVTSTKQPSLLTITIIWLLPFCPNRGTCSVPFHVALLGDTIGIRIFLFLSIDDMVWSGSRDSGSFQLPRYAKSQRVRDKWHARPTVSPSRTICLVELTQHLGSRSVSRLDMKWTRSRTQARFLLREGADRPSHVTFENRRKSAIPPSVPVCFSWPPCSPFCSS